MESFTFIVIFFLKNLVLVTIELFSPVDSGFWSKNLRTGKTLQEDIIEMFYNTLKQKTIDKGLERTRSISVK